MNEIVYYALIRVFISSFTEMEGFTMIYWAVIFLVIAIIAGIFGLTGVAAVAADIAWILFVVGLILAVIFFVASRRKPKV